MPNYEIEYKVTSREFMVTEADDAEQAEQFAREYVDDMYSYDLLDFKIINIDEVKDNN